MTWKAILAKADLSDRVEFADTDLLAFDGVVRYVTAGEWTAELLPTAWQTIQAWVLLAPDVAPPLFAIAEGRNVIMCGPVGAATRERTGPDTTVTLSGVDDMAAILGSRIIYPEPSNSIPWTTDAYHVVTGIASTAIAALISEHRGVTAIPSRQGTTVTVTDTVTGTDGTWQFRLTPLLEAVATIARERGIAVTLTRDVQSNTVDINLGRVRNRTNIVLDDSKLGDSSISLSTATATTVITGGQGEGTSRLFAIAGDQAAGNARIETFSNQTNIATQPQLQASADAERAAGAATAAFSGQLTAEAAALYQWHRDYELGDQIALRVGSTAWPVAVQAVTVHWGSDGQRVTPVLGYTPRHALRQLLRDVAGLSSRVNGLEAS